MNDKLQAPKGTIDLLPPKSEAMELLASRALEIFRLYGYSRIDTPAFEQTDLFERGLEPGSDIVTKEMYTFQDKGGRSLTLRPDMTAPVMRAILEHGLHKKGLPLKLHYHVNVFRHEKPQAQRFRQFTQVGVEAVGTESPSIDAEVIELAAAVLDASGVEDFGLRLNSIGHAECREAYMPKLVAFLESHKEELCPDCRRKIDRNPLRTFDCKVESDIKLMEDAPLLPDFICTECRDHYESVKSLLDSSQVSYAEDPKLVRGLDYYSRTTFEFTSSKLGAQNSVGGGGRYDTLSGLLGGERLPGIGFGLGVERINSVSTLALPSAPGVYVVAAGEEHRAMAFQLSMRLRKAGLRTELDHLGRSLKAQLRAAEKLDYQTTVILGDREVAEESATVKNMATGDQEKVSLADLVGHLRSGA